jgi:hypothetical protein
MPHPRPAHLGLALLVLAGGCESATPSDSAISDTAIRTDSAGVLLVEYPDLPPIEASRIAIAAEPDLVLGEGGALAGPDHEFFQITGVSQLRDGTLVVTNNGSSELRFYGADGRLLRSAGGVGDGPGEFRDVGHHWLLAGDTVVVWDWRARRLQHFGPDGAFVRAASMAETPFSEFPSRREPQAVLEEGRVVVIFESVPRPTQGRPERLPLLVALYRIGVGKWDSVRVVPGFEQIVVPMGGSLGLPGYSFGAYTVAAGAGATMAVADAAHFRVELFDPDGRLVSILSASVPEVPVTSDVVEAFIEHSVAHAPSGAELAAYRERLRREVPARPHAPFLPAVRDVFVDADERIWVERYDVPGSGPSRWEVFGRDGTWIGRVEMPEGFARGRRAELAPGFSVTSGRLAGVWTDPDTGVETVRVYRVIELDS